MKKQVRSLLLIMLLLTFLFVPQQSCFAAEEFKVTSIRFFEGRYDAPSEEKRNFLSTFPQSASRYIWCQVDTINNLYNIRSHTHDIQFRYYENEGTFVGESKGTWTFKPEWETSWNQHGWGWETPGYWKPGVYTVKVLMDGKQVGQNQFTITQDLVKPLKPTFEYEFVKLFESSKHNDPNDNTIYSNRFPQSTTRYVNVFVGAKNLQYGVSDQISDLVGVYYKPDGNIMGVFTARVPVPSSWKEVDLWSGWGWDEPGYWQPGTYKAAIFLAGRLVAQDQFIIYED